MFQILHCADLHLDSSFASGRLPAAVGSWRRADLRATLGRILTLAREQQVDAVTMAGDIFEQDYVLPDTADFLVQQFTKLAPIRVFIAPGERDPYTNDSLYALTRWPENVMVFSQGQLSAVEMAPGIYLWGAACPPARGHRVLDNFHVNHDGVNLLLLHATDAKQPGIGSTALFSVDAAAVHAAGFDLALLGHQHSGRLWPEDAPCCVYPGSPEPLAPEEADGTHQVVLLTIQEETGFSRKNPVSFRTELIPISQWRYLPLRVDLTDCSSTDETTTRVEQSLQSIQRNDDERVVCHVTLTGLPDFDLDVEALAGQVKTKAHVRYETRLSLPYDLEQLAQEQTVRGLLVRRFQARLKNASSDQEHHKLLNALNYALEALDGKQVRPNEIG
jgi:exonuclease SbcD